MSGHEKYTLTSYIRSMNLNIKRQDEYLLSSSLFIVMLNLAAYKIHDLININTRTIYILVKNNTLYLPHKTINILYISNDEIYIYNILIIYMRKSVSCLMTMSRCGLRMCVKENSSEGISFSYRNMFC